MDQENIGFAFIYESTVDQAIISRSMFVSSVSRVSHHRVRAEAYLDCSFATKLLNLSKGPSSRNKLILVTSQVTLWGRS